MKQKKIIALVTALALAIGIAGCDKLTAGTADPSQTDVTDKTDASDSSEPSDTTKRKKPSNDSARSN